MRNLLSLTLGIGLAGATLMACNGDDNGTTSGNDASFNDTGSSGSGPGTDGQAPGIDASESDASAATDSGSSASDGSAPGTDGQGQVDGGGVDGGGSDASACNFATFVKGLVATSTTMTALPSTDLGQGCTDDQNQAEFQTLFP